MTTDQPETNAPEAPSITTAEVRKLRERTIRNLHEYRRGLVKLRAVQGAVERVDNALRALGAQ